MRIKTIQTSNKNFILKYFRCRDGKRTETRIGMEGICITHSCIPLYTVYMQHIMAHSGGMQEWVIQITSIPILVSVLFPSLHLRIKFLLLAYIYYYVSDVNRRTFHEDIQKAQRDSESTACSNKSVY